MEHTGLEPVTSTLPVWRAPNCANAPLCVVHLYFITDMYRNLQKNAADEAAFSVFARR